MAENRSINRPAHRRAGSDEQSFSVDRERAHRARQAAEALFAPKPRAAETSAAPAAGKRAPATLLPAPAPAARRPDDTSAIRDEPQPRRRIPSAHATRIRLWLRYGMSKAQVAAVYGVEIGEIERILRQV
jgi:hypothetical protein